MPLYEYQCSECEHLEEVLQKVGAPAPLECPACGKEHTMKKAVSQTSFHLKGGGWYKDLYSSTPAGADAKGGSAKGSGAKAEKAEKKAEKSESKPATKTEKAPAKTKSEKAA